MIFLKIFLFLYMFAGVTIFYLNHWLPSIKNISGLIRARSVELASKKTNNFEDFMLILDSMRKGSKRLIRIMYVFLNSFYFLVYGCALVKIFKDFFSL